MTLLIILFYNLIWWDYTWNYGKNIKLNTRFILDTIQIEFDLLWFFCFHFFFFFIFPSFFIFYFHFFFSILFINKKTGLSPHLFKYSYEQWKRSFFFCFLSISPSIFFHFFSQFHSFIFSWFWIYLYNLFLFVTLSKSIKYVGVPILK